MEGRKIFGRGAGNVLLDEAAVAFRKENDLSKFEDLAGLPKNESPLNSDAHWHLMKSMPLLRRLQSERAKRDFEAELDEILKKLIQGLK